MFFLIYVTHLLKLNDKVKKEQLRLGFLFYFIFLVRFTRFHSENKEPKSSILIVKQLKFSKKKKTQLISMSLNI